jgi:two-component system, OmpR family, sensor kinase
MSLPIRTRITLWYLALLTAVVLAAAALLLLRLRSGLIGGLDEGLATRAAQISLGLQRGCEGEFRDVTDASLVGLPLGESAAQLLAPDGSVRESTGDAAANQPLIDQGSITQIVNGGTYRATVTASPDAEPFRVLAVAMPAGQCDGVIAVATSQDGVAKSVRELTLLLLIAGPGVILLAGAGGWWLTGRALSPVARMTEEADAIGVERLDERIEVPAADDELRHLASTLNSMLDRLARGLEDRRRFVADASHELRTPLAVMRSELDVGLRDPDLRGSARETLSSTVQEVERMQATVENLLTLARADDGSLGLLREDVDLLQVANAVATSSESSAKSADVHIAVSGPSVRAYADRLRIEQVLNNLVQNAIRYSPPASEICVETWEDGTVVGCSVRDSGPGVPSHIADRIFERFVRADPTRSQDGGSGLGLAISREIIGAHGGDIWLDTGSNGGAIFSFGVPRVTANGLGEA